MTDGFKDDIQSRAGLSDHPYHRYFDTTESKRQIIDRVIRAWVDWPTNRDAAPLWAVAAEETGNRNDRPVESFGSNTDRGSMLDVPVSSEDKTAIREFLDFVRSYIRPTSRSGVEAYRYVEEPPGEASSFTPYTLESWTNDVTQVRDFARTVRGSEGEASS